MTEHEAVIARYRNELHAVKEHARKKEHLLQTSFDFSLAAAGAAVSGGAICGAPVKNL